MDAARVHLWLSALPSHPSENEIQQSQQQQQQNQQHIQSKKRVRGLVSPPMSTDRDLSPPKRRRQTHEDDDSNDNNNYDDPFTSRADAATSALQEATPRPARSLRLATTTDDALSISASSASSVSRSSSPRKQLTGLRALPASQGGAEVCPFDIEDDRTPDGLVDLVLALQSRSALLPPSEKERVQTHYKDTRAARQWRDPSLYGAEREALGPTPEPRFVDDVVRQARECDGYMLDEAAWSSMVYYPVLREIFASPDVRSRLDPDRGSGANTTGTPGLADLTVVPCASASLIPRYRMLATPFKKVDFAIAYHPKDNRNNSHTQTDDHHHTPTSSRYERLKALVQSTPSPDQSLNHTGYAGLCDRPIALSVEVKRTNDSADTAKLQLLTWLSAQWNKLDELCPDSSLVCGGGQAMGKKPEYLLALLIQGHDWNLVASSREPEGKRVVSSFNIPLFHAAGTQDEDVMFVHTLTSRL